MPKAVTPLRRTTLLRDVAIFYLKLLLDAMRGVLIVQVGLFAAVLDFVFAGRLGGSWFYRVLDLSERFDLWLNLYAARGAATDPDGLFGRSTAGEDTLLGRLEQLVRDGDAPRPAVAHASAALVPPQ